MKCVKSPSGECEYYPSQYGRDDQGFFLDCIHCGETAFFDCDTEDDFYNLFGLNDDTEDYHSEDEDEDEYLKLSS